MLGKPYQNKYLLIKTGGKIARLIANIYLALPLLKGLHEWGVINSRACKFNGTFPETNFTLMLFLNRYVC